MRCTYLLSLALLLANSSSNRVSARTQFVDLVDDVLFDTFNLLDLSDLMNMASTNLKIASVTGAVYRRKYGDYGLHVRESVFNRDIIQIDSSWKIIQIRISSLAFRFLKSFGDFIPILCIDEKFANEILENIHVPLKRVEDFRTTLKHNASIGLPFSQLFPQLKKMTIELKANVHFSMIDCVLPYLNYLNIHLFYYAWNQIDSIKGLFQKNPNIKSIQMYGFPSNNINGINMALPNLENLTSIYEFSTDKEILQFDNVKHFTLQGKNDEKNYSNEKFI